MSKQELQKTVDDFQEKLPRPGIGKLTVDWYDLKGNQAQPWPNGGKPGVYMFLDADEKLLYVGKASSGRNLRTRLRGYFNPQKVPKDTNQGKKAIGARYVGLLGLPADHGFEAPAIEEWLITCLQPPKNKMMKSKIDRKTKRKAEKDLIKAHQEEYDELVRLHS